MKISTEEKSSLVAWYQAGESATETARLQVYRIAHSTLGLNRTMITTDSGYEVSQQAFFKLNQKLHKLEQKLEILQKVDCTASAPLQEN